MKYLNLTHGFNPMHAVIEETITYDSMTFNGGEPHIRIRTREKCKEDVTVTIRLNSFNDVGILAVAVDALKELKWVGSISLLVPYFPGARQDRRALMGEPLTVKVYADIINRMGFKDVIIFDAHSPVTCAVLNNCTDVSSKGFLEEVLRHVGDIPEMRLVSPDAGAAKKVRELSIELRSQPFDVVYCSKSRNTSTGALSDFRVQGEVLKNAPCLVVDDICDGGGTFIGLAQELRRKGAGKLYLAVSHGIFSKGFEELSKFYDHIFTTDSIGNVNGIEVGEFVTEIKINHLV